MFKAGIMCMQRTSCGSCFGKVMNRPEMVVDKDRWKFRVVK